MTPIFTWNDTSEKAAGLLVEGVSYLETAKAVGVSKSTIIRWKKNPEFDARVTGVTSVAREAVQQHAIANKEVSDTF